MIKINRLAVYEIHNNRLDKSIEVVINKRFRGASPSGASKGKRELKELPVKKAMAELKKIFPKYVGEELNFEIMDREIKHLKHKIGSNGSTAFSFALFNAYFSTLNLSGLHFPLPLGNVVGGGKHHGFTDIQEFLVIPLKAKTFPQAMDILASIYEEVYDAFKDKFCGYNDEGAQIIKAKQNKILDVLTDISSKYKAKVGVDFASNSYYNFKRKTYFFNGREISRDKYIEKVIDMINSYDLFYAEDVVQENDVEGFIEICKNTKSYITGDDLTVTNAERIRELAQKKAIRGVIIKPNQIGTITEAIDAKKVADKHNLLAVLSHRSGEVDDYTLSRIAIVYGFKVIKAGVAQSRIPKLNELIRLWYQTENPKLSKI